MGGTRNTKWIKSVFLVLSIICFLLAVILLILLNLK
jgi:hypothetical protein